jgi:DNA-binding NarL/FixJ family response regulator
MIRSITVEPAESEAGLSRAALLSAIARKRRDPLFYVVDADLQLMCASAGLANSGRTSLPPEVRDAARMLLERPRLASETLVTPLGERSILRLVPAAGSKPLFVIFVTEARNPIALAAKRYGFTTREIDVLELLLRGKSTGAIARELTISDLTVLQHVKNVGHKMGVSKRKEIVATLVGVR